MSEDYIQRCGACKRHFDNKCRTSADENFTGTDGCPLWEPLPQIVQSIKTEWWQKIKSGEKKIEASKTYPKKDGEKIVLVYETKAHGGSGKIVAQYRLKRTVPIKYYPFIYADIPFYDTDKMGDACLTQEQIDAYAAEGEEVYGWVIDDLEIFDRPFDIESFGLEKAPQSWCYL